MKKVFCLALLAYLYLIQSALAEEVISVHDGDTFTITNGERIRLSGIDAPELKQPYGIESRDFLAKLVQGREVVLECSGYSYDRRVCNASVIVNEGTTLDIQKEIVGWGLAYDSFKYSHGLYANAESFARNLKRGVWQQSDGGIRPWDYRASTRIK